MVKTYYNAKPFLGYKQNKEDPQLCIHEENVF